eukprot:3445308-Alexandrium_andersonii.AAC.1
MARERYACSNFPTLAMATLGTLSNTPKPLRRSLRALGGVIDCEGKGDLTAPQSNIFRLSQTTALYRLKNESAN